MPAEAQHFCRRVTVIFRRLHPRRRAAAEQRHRQARGARRRGGARSGGGGARAAPRLWANTSVKWGSHPCLAIPAFAALVRHPCLGIPAFASLGRHLCLGIPAFVSLARHPCLGIPAFPSLARHSKAIPVSRRQRCLAERKGAFRDAVYVIPQSAPRQPLSILAAREAYVVEGARRRGALSRPTPPLAPPGGRCRRTTVTRGGITMYRDPPKKMREHL